MAYNDVSNIMRLLKSFNNFNPNSKTPSFKRSAFYYVEKKYVESYKKPILIDAGHFFGKTTLLNQTIDTLLQQGVPRKNILYISFNYPLTRGCAATELIRIYRREAQIDGILYCLLDNVEYTEDFAKLCESADHNMRILAAASVHMEGMNGGNALIRYVPMAGMTFFEYCEYHNRKPAYGTPLPYPGELHMVQETVLDSFYKGLAPLYNLFEDYIKSGGYFEPYPEDDGRFYDNAVDKAVTRDIPMIFDARSVMDVEKVFVYICYLSGRTISVNAISKALKISRATVERYIEFFEKTNLITIHEPIDWEVLNSVKGFKKIYINNYRMQVSALHMGGTESAEFDPDLKNAVKTEFLHHSVQFLRDGTHFGFFKKTANANRTDIVMHFPDTINALVHVQYSDKSQLRANDWLLTYADRTYPNYLITKKPDDYGMVKFDDGRGVCKIPAYAALYLLGYFEKYKPMLKGDDGYALSDLHKSLL